MAGASLMDLIGQLSADARRARGWEERLLSPGEVLFEQGDPADRLFVVVEGSLGLTVDGRELGRIEQGGSLGESTVFFVRESRMGRVTALAASRLFSLRQPQLIEMRDAFPDAYDLILDAALREACDRLAQMERRAGLRRVDAGVGAGSWPPAPTTQGPPPSDIVRTLRTLPVLQWTSATIITEIFETATPRFVPEGHALFREGEPARSMFLLASGALDLYRGASRPLTSLGRGSLLGADAYVSGGQRTASAIAHSDAWLLEFGGEARLATLPRRVLREATLTALRLQLRGANRMFDGMRFEKESLSSVVGAAANLEGWRAGDPLTGFRIEEMIAPGHVGAPDDEFADLCRLIRGSVIGREAAIETPFGMKRMVYADYTASGRSLTFIEDFLRERVLPLYANTHTEASASGSQTTRLREEAREAVARSVHATEADEVIFVGSGATGAINRLVDILGLRMPAGGNGARPPAERPVVFIGPYEHHSNILPWRHSIADVVEIPASDAGELDLDALRSELERHADRPLRIGSFSAASNVTGLATPVDAVAQLLHAHGAWSFWDYAAAGPYVPIDMNPAAEGAHKDAIFISPHKFVGGPGTPGILVLKRDLVTSDVPTNPGGGTVDFVTASDSLYSKSIAHREESGTPAIIESIRCGLAFRLKDQAGPHRIHEMERRYVRTAIESWTQNFKIRVLGPLEAERISIVSFLIRHGRGYLHYNFVVALLNDLFGLQARGGCSCAGPYGARLFGLEEQTSTAFLDLTRRGLNCYKPGWARVNFNYFVSEEEFRYIVEAVHLVAMHGYALLPQYEVDAASGLWSHRSGTGFRPASLSELELTGGAARWAPGLRMLGDEVLAGQLAEARTILENATRAVPDPISMPEMSAEEKRWRWFPLPSEQAAWLRHINGDDERPVVTEGILAEPA